MPAAAKTLATYFMSDTVISSIDKILLLSWAVWYSIFCQVIRQNPMVPH